MDTSRLNRPMVVMDSDKLGFFMRAARVRAGTFGTYGALSGSPTGIFGAPAPYVCDDQGHCCDFDTGSIVPCPGKQADPSATAANTAMGTSAGSVGDWFSRLIAGIAGNPSPSNVPPPTVKAAGPGIGTMLLIGGGVVVAGIVALKVFKKA